MFMYLSSIYISLFREQCLAFSSIGVHFFEVFIGFRGMPSLKILECMFGVINSKSLFANSSKFQLVEMRIANTL